MRALMAQSLLGGGGSRDEGCTALVRSVNPVDSRFTEIEKRAIPASRQSSRICPSVLSIKVQLLPCSISARHGLPLAMFVNSNTPPGAKRSWETARRRKTGSEQEFDGRPVL